MTVRLTVALGVFEGLAFELLDDPEAIRALLVEAVAAGGFSLLNLHLHRFEPQGVTGLALVGESHLALHTWPEAGVLFVDIASCTSRAAARASLEALAARLPGARMTLRESIYEGPAQAGPPRLEHVASAESGRAQLEQHGLTEAGAARLEQQELTEAGAARLEQLRLAGS